MKYRKKPIVIEAFQMTRDRRYNHVGWPEWLNHAWLNHAWNTDVEFQGEDGTLFCVSGGERLFLGTKEGVMSVAWDDWIIQGVQGELYPCKPAIFEATYEPVEE